MEQQSVADISTPPPWSVIELMISNGDTGDTSSEITVLCDFVRFVIHTTESGLASSPELKERYCAFINASQNHEVDDSWDEDFFDWALEPLLPVLREHAVEVKHTATLHDFVHAPILEYSLEAQDNKLILRQKKQDSDFRLMFSVSAPQNDRELWPGYLPSDIKLHDAESYDMIPRKVFLPDGTVAFFKAVRGGYGRHLEDVVAPYTKVRASKLPETVCVPRLLGLVHDGRGSVFGLLITYIDCEEPDLIYAIDSGASNALRSKWAEQITNIVHGLHEHDLVCGDARRHNVLIDKDQNAWLIGFGHRYPDDWVPQPAGTIDGDLAALRKIVCFITGQSSQ
ncbi:hypothetical protein PWT90_05340 [Aphanocladium album]|nr:hypothetical protein PWT90_05340 [Aphanocladium album]